MTLVYLFLMPSVADVLVFIRWEYDESYCDAVKKTPPYDAGPRLLDIIDTAIFDYLIGNADRHHYESFQDDEGASMLILLDNAKRLVSIHLLANGTFLLPFTGNGLRY